MISNIFGKTKPINFIIVFALLSVLYLLTNFIKIEQQLSASTILFHLLTLIVLLLSIYLVNFIAKRNKITAPNSFGILFYALLIMLFSTTLTDYKAVFSSFFLLLALRRIVSLRSLVKVKLKIFDATTWVLISSLFYEWMILYLILVLIAIYIYVPKNIRNWLVPLTAVFTVFSITFSILLVLDKSNFIGEHYQFALGFNTAYFLSWDSSSKLILYILVTVLVGIFAFLKLGKAGVGQIVTMRLLFFSFILGLAVKVLTIDAMAFPVIITFFPAIVFMTNYVEAIKKPNFKEVALMLLLLAPFLVFITELTLK